jgi:hypothetical protein
MSQQPRMTPAGQGLPILPGGLTAQQSKNLMVNLGIYPAITVLVFLRRKVGLRQLSAGRLVIMGLIVAFVPSFLGNFNLTGFAEGVGVPQPASTTDYLPPLFALALVGYGLWQRHQRWNDVLHNVDWSTRSLGASYFEGRIPLLSESAILRFIDPLVCAVAGLIVAVLSRPLSVWILFSAVCVAMIESIVQEQELDDFLDQFDAGVKARALARDIASIEQHERGQAPSQTGGQVLVTGLAPEWAKQVQERQRMEAQQYEAYRRAQAQPEKESESPPESGPGLDSEPPQRPPLPDDLAP